MAHLSLSSCSHPYRSHHGWHTNWPHFCSSSRPLFAALMARHVDGSALSCSSGRWRPPTLLGYIYPPIGARNLIHLCGHRRRWRSLLPDLGVFPTQARYSGHGDLRHRVGPLDGRVRLWGIFQLAPMDKTKSEAVIRERFVFQRFRATGRLHHATSSWHLSSKYAVVHVCIQDAIKRDCRCEDQSRVPRC